MRHIIWQRLFFWFVGRIKYFKLSLAWIVAIHRAWKHSFPFPLGRVWHMPPQKNKRCHLDRIIWPEHSYASTAVMGRQRGPGRGGGQRICTILGLARSRTSLKYGHTNALRHTHTQYQIRAQRHTHAKQWVHIHTTSNRYTKALAVFQHNSLRMQSIFDFL